MKKRYAKIIRIIASFIIMVGVSLGLSSRSYAAVGVRSASNAKGDVFLGGNYIEVGISKGGTFGTSQLPPASFHSHVYKMSGLGLISDGDGWDMGAAPTAGDFFLPGTPEERYIVGYYYNGKLYDYNVADRQNVATTNWKVAPTTTNQSTEEHLKAVTTGITAQNIRYTQTVEFDADDKEFLTTIEIENAGTRDVTGVRYTRSFDPDQDQERSGTYETYNKVISNPKSTSYNKETDVAMVVARGAQTLDGYFFAAFDQRARASRGVSFSPNSTYLNGLWSANTGVPTEPTEPALEMTKSSLNGYKKEDNAIALTFDLGTIKPGEKVAFDYYSSLDPNVLESIMKLKAKFANVSANEKDCTIGPFEMGYYTVNDGINTYNIDIVDNDSQLAMVGTDRDGNPYNFAGKEISIVLKGDNDKVEDSDPQILEIPPQFNYEGVLTVRHGSVPEAIRLAAAIIHLQMRTDNESEWGDIATKVIIFNKNKQTQNIPYCFPNLWVRWMDPSKPDYQYRIVVDADNYRGANTPTTARDITIEYTSVKEERNPIERTTIVFDDNGGAGGAGAINLFDKKILPDTIEVPSRVGYDFLGYYKGFLGGVQYYDEKGKKVAVDLYDRPWETDAELAGYTVYANWRIHRSTVTIDADGGSFSGETSYTGNYGESILLPNPTKPGSTFLRWIPSVNNCDLTEALNDYYYQFGPDEENVTLKAIWFEDNQIVIDKSQTTDSNIDCQKLSQIFKNVSQETGKGITVDDLKAGGVTLKVSIADAPEGAGEPIETLVSAGDSEQLLKCYDISVNKSVGGNDTRLVELPATITVSIPLTGELADQNGYAVYRIHEGVPEKLSFSDKATEYCEVIDNVLYIHTKKFSIYGVAGLQSVIGELEEFTEENDHANGNVYARYIDGSMIGVYKIDIAWGTMKYDFTKTVQWNPDMHRYDIDISLDEVSAYDGINNKILITNHSNGDVRVTATVSNSIGFDGIGIDVKTTNDEHGELLVETDIPKVSDDSGAGTVATATGYVRLDAMLNNDSVLQFEDPEKYYKVGIITIAIDSLGDTYTPMTH